MPVAEIQDKLKAVKLLLSAFLVIAVFFPAQLIVRPLCCLMVIRIHCLFYDHIDISQTEASSSLAEGCSCRFFFGILTIGSHVRMYYIVILCLNKLTFCWQIV